MDEKINNQILAGEITALTIDTSIFERNSLALEGGLLAQLEQFHESEFELLIANTVANEVKRHLAKNATDTTKSLLRLWPQADVSPLTATSSRLAMSAFCGPALPTTID